jgi:Xaa-Pro aminopeptidase
MVSRLNRFTEKLKQDKLDRFIVSNIFNVRYLSGFSGSTAWMIVGDEAATLVTDFRYKEQAEAEVYGGIEVRIDTRNALEATCDMLSGLEGRIGFESGSVTYASYQKFKGELGAELVPVEGAIENLRQRKDEGEIASITRAVEIADSVFGEIIKELKPGMTEVDVAARIDFLLRKKSTEVPAFETIVASGEHASLPHATPTARVIREGDLLKMDYGAIWDGYCSDITRTVALGKASDKQREIYGIVLEANKKAIAGMKAGLKASEADGLARQHIEAKGYGENFGHSLGHGVGIEVHEGPRLSQKSDEVLESGMVATVEPGIYIPGWGGVRIEDVVLIEDDGCKVLTTAAKGLVEVGV